MNRPSVIFGGCGYIGRHWAERLAARNPGRPIILADIRPPPTVLPAPVHYAACDVRHPLPPQLGALRPEWIFHFAAVHREPGHAPQEYFDTNLPGARNVCAFAEETACRQILFTSSISVYGPATKPTSENAPLYPQSPYGISKLCAELIHEAWWKAGPQRRLVVCRPGVVYGPGDPGNILRMIRALKHGYFFFPASSRIRKSYAYIEGLLDSFEFAMARPEPHLVYNYVEKETETIGQLARIVRQHLHCRAPMLCCPPALLIPAAALTQILTRGRSPLHPARVRKAATPTHIVPQRLQEWGFPFRFDFRSSLEHWSKTAQGDFS